MIADIQLSTRSIDLLQRRSLNTSEIADFEALLMRAREQQVGENTSARDVLAALNPEALDLVRRASGLVNTINVSQLSDEGAINLLRQPDSSDRVDLNNDGLVEVGEGRLIVFPPVNASQSVKDAWVKATDGMSEQNKITAQLRFHHAVYGIQIEGVPTKVALPPEQQWNTTHTAELFSQLRDSLAFSVAREGWTDTHRMFRDLYDRFERTLA